MVGVEPQGSIKFAAITRGLTSLFCLLPFSELVYDGLKACGNEEFRSSRGKTPVDGGEQLTATGG